MKALRIVFMGTPDFAVATLIRLLDEKYDVVGVVTAPDRPSGRGQRISESSVKKFARKNGLTVLQPKSLKSKTFLKELKSLKANLQVVVAFRMLPKAVWQMPKFGTFNLHASLLPQYRGAAPINWAIINGEKETGVTTFFIDEKIDTGAVIISESVAIVEDDTAGSLHDRLMETGSELVIRTLQLIATNRVKTTKQPDLDALRRAPKLNRENCRIDWNGSARKIYNHIRGLSPYPVAWTKFFNGDDDAFLKIYAASIFDRKHTLQNGTLVLEKKRLLVAVSNGFIELLEVQFPGKRRLPVSSVVNGIKLKKKAHVR